MAQSLPNHVHRELEELLPAITPWPIGGGVQLVPGAAGAGAAASRSVPINPAFASPQGEALKKLPAATGLALTHYRFQLAALVALARVVYHFGVPFGVALSNYPSLYGVPEPAMAKLFDANVKYNHLLECERPFHSVQFALFLLYSMGNKRVDILRDLSHAFCLEPRVGHAPKGFGNFGAALMMCLFGTRVYGTTSLSSILKRAYEKQSILGSLPHEAREDNGSKLDARAFRFIALAAVAAPCILASCADGDVFKFADVGEGQWSAVIASLEEFCGRNMIEIAPRDESVDLSLLGAKDATADWGGKAILEGLQPALEAIEAGSPLPDDTPGLALYRIIAEVHRQWADITVQPEPAVTDATFLHLPPPFLAALTALALCFFLGPTYAVVRTITVWVRCCVRPAR